MNIFQQLKERKVLDKDGKVDALGPYGKNKLTGQEVAQYFKQNKVKDAKIKKAVEVALDLGGAMDIATKEIKKFFGASILKKKEVQNALQFANESFEFNQMVGMLHEDVLNLTEKNLMPDIKKIVDTKGAAKVGGVMIDMFTASVVQQVYDKVSDQNKKKMEKSKIEVLVKLAHKVMGMKEEADLRENDEGLKNKAEKSGMPLGILKQVYKRGLAAYKTGHRPGTTAPQWAMARVNSFITKSSGTWGKADSDLAAKVKGESFEMDESINEKLDLVLTVRGDKNVKLAQKELKKFKGVKVVRQGKTKKGEEVVFGGDEKQIQKMQSALSGKVKGLDMVSAHESVDMTEGKYLKYSNLLMKKAKEMQAIDKAQKKSGVKSPSLNAIKAIDKEIEKEMKKLGILNDDVQVEGDAVSRAQQAAIAISKKEKENKKESVMDSYRKMWDDAVVEETIVEKKEFNPSAVEKIADMTDRNDHNGSMMLLAKEMKEMKVVKMLKLLIQMHKEQGHMTNAMMDMRKDISKELFKKAEKTYSNYDAIYKAF
jgi:hypothetical protein